MGAFPKTREDKRRAKWMRAYGRELVRLLPGMRNEVNWAEASYAYLNSRDDGATAARKYAERKTANRDSHPLTSKPDAHIVPIADWDS